MTQIQKSSFKFLKDIILKEFYSYAYDGMRFTNKFRITTSWFTKTTRGQASPMHNHDNCMFSCVLYLQTSQHSGDIVFVHSDLNQFGFAKNNNGQLQLALTPEILFKALQEIWELA